MPWTTLGLDPEGASERDVKRAYAKRLRVCRPDQDPEGFRKLHDAYQAALRELQWRSEGDDDNDPWDAGGGTLPIEITRTEQIEELRPREGAAFPIEASSDDTLWTGMGTFEPSAGLRAITDCFDRLESALANGGGDIPMLVEQAEILLYEHPSEAIRWGELMQEVFARHGDHSALVLKAATIVFELEHGGTAATLAVVERLDRRGDSQGIATLANLLLQNKARIATPAAGIVAARLAGAAAFWARGRTERLADFAYQHLGRGERDFHMQHIDRHVAMASMMALVPVHLKSFWRQRMMHSGGRHTWEDAESKAAIAWLRSPMARRGPSFEVLVGLLPAELAASVRATSEKVRVREWEQAAPGGKPAKWERRSSPAYSISPPGWSWILLVIFGVRMLVTCANQMASESSSPPRLNPFPPASLEKYDPETQRRINEGSEKFRELRDKRDKSEGAVPETPSIVPARELKLDQDTPENPLFRQFESGTR